MEGRILVDIEATHKLLWWNCLNCILLYHFTGTVRAEAQKLLKKSERKHKLPKHRMEFAGRSSENFRLLFNLFVFESISPSSPCSLLFFNVKMQTLELLSALIPRTLMRIHGQQTGIVRDSFVFHHNCVYLSEKLSWLGRAVCFSMI